MIMILLITGMGINMKYYIVNFDRKYSLSYRDFHNEFTESQMIHNWFHYIQSSYIVASNSTVDDISQHFINCADNNNMSSIHLVMEVHLPNRQGILAIDAWEWLQKNSNS